MPKRKLTRRQSWQIQKIQKDRLLRAKNQSTIAEQQLKNGTLGDEKIGQIVAHYGANLDVEDEHGHIHHCLTRANLPMLVCGDNIIWQATGKQLGVIISLVPRNSFLARPDYNKQLKPVAANIDQILVVAAPKPVPDQDLINRYLVAAELTAIRPLIVINKIDLLNKLELQTLAQRLSLYKSIGYRVIYTSTKHHDGLSELTDVLKKHTSIFVGQSGVGKSSLIKTFIPNANIRVGELSQATGLGKHTTSVTVLYHTENNGSIIDSPGVREFGLGHESPERITNGFVEFKPWLGQCKFKDCKHSNEPACAIKLAVEQNLISQRRLDSYLRIVKSLSRR
ncbi:MAG: small ribosomal subunit biogenesis GTPase RsgA [Gammaproteobacteria bacterium]|nr:small ribosomal subunit biogenesis GTPase RsgA [Gammaproteobacteria bacterium]